MYFKLINKNFKKTFQDYAIYFATLGISAGLFFAFMSLTSRNNSVLIDTPQYSFEMFQKIIKYATYIISLAFVVLINYVNKHMLKKRSREFSTYMILGMERSNVAFLFFMETLMIGVLAVVVGSVVGTILSGALISLILISITNSFKFHLGFYPDTFVITLLFFTIVFILIGFMNIRKLTKSKLIDLLSNDKIAEGKKISNMSYILSTVVTVTCFSCGFIIIKDFFSMGRNYTGNIPPVISNRFQTVLFISLILGVFSDYYSISYIIILVKNKLTNFKYLNLNLILLNNLYSKISSNAKVMATVIIAIVISVAGFMLAPVLAEVSEGYLDYRVPYDIIINNQYNYIDKIEDIPEIDYSFMDDILQDNDIEIEENCQMEGYFIWDDFKNKETRKNKWDYPRLAISISDYNQMRKMAGYEPISLGNNEFVMHLDYEMDKQEVLKSIDASSESIKLNDGTVLNLNPVKIYNEPLTSYMFNFNTDDVLVFPDEVCKSLYIAITNYYANTKQPISYNLCEKLEMIIGQTFKEKYSYLYEKYEVKYSSDKDYRDFIHPMRFKTKEINDVTLGATSVRLVGIYIGIIFFIICLTVLALQQLTDSIENKEKFAVLNKMGVDKENIFKLITKQITVYFGVPCVFSILCSVMVLYTFILRFGNKVKVYIGSLQFIYNVSIPMVLMVIILISYFMATVYSYRHNVKGIFNSKHRL
ncbi:MAG: ABC transporter permease [Clostridiaceae bacterium]